VYSCRRSERKEFLASLGWREVAQALAQQRQPRVTHTRIVAIIPDALCQATSEPMPLIKSPQRQQAGIAGDLATGKISANGSVSVEGKQQLWYTRCPLWVLRKRMLGSAKTQCSSIF
jgi:hypothetical protein